jgi:hypothetical protein
LSATTTDLGFLLSRAGDTAAFERWLDLGRSTGWCEHPVRLAGNTLYVDPATGEIVSSYTTAGELDGHLLKACGTRRATACGPCSETYRADAWHLIAAGLRGGKGVPAEAATHPTLFLTLTAPSFGPVHTRRARDGSAQICHPRRTLACPHGRHTHCRQTHRLDDDRLGDPLCADCFDYRGAVLWNAHATELWRRTTIAIRRELAKALDMPVARFADQARLSYAKVVEYQDRGLVHLHVVIRLDGPSGPADPPPEDLPLERLEKAVITASQRARFSYPTTEGITGDIRWGQQIDVRHVALDATAPGAVAAYIAKYATKSTDAFGRLDHRLHESNLPSLDVRPHLKRLVLTAWELGGRPELEHLGLRRWAHTLGFRGHWLTKSRRYSTTLGALRSARALWSANRRDSASDVSESVAIKDWRFSGRGWANPGDEWLARTAAATRTESRQLAREQRLAERRD